MFLPLGRVLAPRPVIDPVRDFWQAIARRVKQVLTESKPSSSQYRSTAANNIALFTKTEPINNCLKENLRGFGFEQIALW